MRWLVPTLAAAATAMAVPAAAQIFGYGYGQSYGYGQPYGGQDFDYRRCYRNESASACRNRLQRQADRRWDDGRYDRSRGGYNYDNRDDRYGSYNRYGYGRYDYGQGYGGSYDPRYYGQGYGGYDQGYYGGAYGHDSGASVALTILGIALGAQILGSLDDRDYWDRNRDDDSYNDWCRRQYSSYDWTSGTYRHQDGSRRYCRRW